MTIRWLLCSTFQAHGKAGKWHFICGIGCWGGGRGTGEVHLRWIWLSHGTKLMHIPRHPERGSLGQGHRSSIEARCLVSASGEVLMSDFLPLEWAASLPCTHTHRRGYGRKSALWSSANPSKFNTDAYSSHCLPVIEYYILWVLVKLLLKFSSIKILFSTLHLESVLLNA